MEDIGKIIITFITGGVLGAFINTYFEFRKDIVSAIWKERFEKYKKIWAITSVLPKWPKDEEVTYKQLYDTCDSLRNWYFNEGGILLSKKKAKNFTNMFRGNFIRKQKSNLEKKSLMRHMSRFVSYLSLLEIKWPKI